MYYHVAERRIAHLSREMQDIGLVCLDAAIGYFFEVECVTVMGIVGDAAQLCYPVLVCIIAAACEGLDIDVEWQGDGVVACLESALECNFAILGASILYVWRNSGVKCQCLSDYGEDGIKRFAGTRGGESGRNGCGVCAIGGFVGGGVCTCSPAYEFVSWVCCGGICDTG